MKTKIIPFDLETAKKIQAEEIKGKIVNRQAETVRIFAFDVQNKKCIVGAVKHALSDGEYIAQWDTEGRAFDDVKESFLDLLIELPEVAPKHEFKPFDKVLVRCYDGDRWVTALYSHYNTYISAHVVCGGTRYKDCVPYEGNENLVGTTDKPKEE